MTRHDLLHDRAAVAGLVRSIGDAATRLRRPATFMEVCGTHTHAVAGAGLRRMLPDGIRLVSGPGCPVCVGSRRWRSLPNAPSFAALPKYMSVSARTKLPTFTGIGAGSDDAAKDARMAITATQVPIVR